jgi:hypothetical protein
VYLFEYGTCEVLLIFVSIRDTVSPSNKGFNQMVGVGKVWENRFVMQKSCKRKNKSLFIMFYSLLLIPQM